MRITLLRKLKWGKMSKIKMPSFNPLKQLAQDILNAVTRYEEAIKQRKEK